MSEGGAIGALRVRVLPDFTGFRGAAQAEGHAAGEVMGSGLAGAVREHWKGLVAGLAVAELGKKTFDFVKDSTGAFKESATGALQLQRAIGGTVEDTSRLRFALHEMGVGGDTANTLFGRLSRTLAVQSETSKGSAKLFSELGFSVRDASGHLRPMSEILPKIADRFKELPSGPEKTALAIQLFGRSGQTMLRFLNQGSEGIKELEGESDKFGNTITTKGVASLKEYGKAHRDLAAAQEGLKITVGQALMPILARFEEFLSAKVVPALIAMGGFFRDHIVPILSSFAGVLTRDVFPAISNTFGWFSRNRAILGPIVVAIVAMVAAWKTWVAITKIATALQVAFNAVMSANPIALVVIAIAALAAGIIYAYKHSKTFRDIVEDVWKWIHKYLWPAVQDLIKAFTWLWKNILEPFGAFLVKVFIGEAKFLWQALKDTWQVTKDVTDVFVWIWHHVLEPLGTFLTGVFVGAWNGVYTAINWVVTAAKTAWSTIADLFKRPINITLDVVSGFAHIVDDVTSAIDLGKPLGSLEHLKHLAGGGKLSGYGGGDSVLAMLEPGEAVVPKHLVPGMAGWAKAHGIPGFAAGGVAPNITPYGYGSGQMGSYGSFNPLGAVFDAGKWVLDKAQHLLRAGAADAADAGYQHLIKPVISQFPGWPGKIAVGGVNTAEKKIIEWIRGKESSDVTGAFVADVGSGVTRWAKLVAQALDMEHLPFTLISRVLSQMNLESGGNPNAINLWDSNAAKGVPSKGLMQVIDPTFAGNHWPGTSWNIYDPLANIAAAINYGAHRYGADTLGMGFGHGYDQGGKLATGTSRVTNATGRPEPVLTEKQWNTMYALAMRGSGAAVQIEHWHGDQTDADGLASMLNAKQRAYAASKGI